ncbi:MAG: flagellar export protein FliJ [Lachnospiraceae bacterium]|nr:flagellar export protein FliJ [Lachnospiraceae bacterium]MDE7020628.1 flagellar export protein FliJ [Lachnospiraceae bacterium]
MARFVYRMQSILNIKIQMENQAKMEFGQAQRRLLEEEERLEGLYNRKEFYLEEGRKLRMDSLKVLSLRDNEYAVARMEEYIEAQKEAVRNAELQVEEARQKLQEVMTERKAQERLREKAFEQFMQEENAREGKEVDELTSYTYGQKRGKSKERRG